MPSATLTKNTTRDTMYWIDTKMMGKKVISILSGCPATWSVSRYVTWMLKAWLSSCLAPSVARSTAIVILRVWSLSCLTHGVARARPLLATKVILEPLLVAK